MDVGGDVADLHASNSFTGKGANILVTEFVKGNEIGGSFKLSYGAETTGPIPFDVDVQTLRSKLESFDEIDHVDAHTDGLVDSELGRLFTVTFLDSETGDALLLIPDATNLTGLGGVISVSEAIKGSFATNNALHVSFDLPRSCSASDVGRPYCGDHITEAVIEFSPRIDFTATTTFYRYFPDYSTQIIRTSYTGESPLRQLSGYFNVAYDGSLSAPINAHATADNVRNVLEELPGVDTAGVERKYASRAVSGICIDTAVGSSLIKCSTSCSPCSFDAEGIKANQLIRVGEEWYRVSSSFDGVQESFEIAFVANSSIIVPYEGAIDLNEWDLYVWTGGYEWLISFYSVVGETKLLTAPMHHMLPYQAAVEIATQDCNKCINVDNLSPDTQYYVRARTKNHRGWSAYSDIISETPKGIPSAPTNIDVNSISGKCSEVKFDPPVYGDPLISYVVQWDYSELFTYAEDDSLASCTSLRYESCILGVVGGSLPIKYKICGLLELEEYFVQVAAMNSVQTQDNTSWSGMTSTVPIDQVPDPPFSLNVEVLVYDGMQISFNWPKQDGGKAISKFVVTYDATEDFSSANQVVILPSLPQKIPNNGDKFVFDFVPTTPQLNAGSTYFVKMNSVNSVGTGIAF